MTEANKYYTEVCTPETKQIEKIYAELSEIIKKHDRLFHAALNADNCDTAMKEFWVTKNLQIAQSALRNGQIDMCRYELGYEPDNKN